MNLLKVFAACLGSVQSRRSVLPYIYWSETGTVQSVCPKLLPKLLSMWGVAGCAEH
jgi:hypothetical protein